MSNRLALLCGFVVLFVCGFSTHAYSDENDYIVPDYIVPDGYVPEMLAGRIKCDDPDSVARVQSKAQRICFKILSLFDQEEEVRQDKIAADEKAQQKYESSVTKAEQRRDRAEQRALNREEKTVERLENQEIKLTKKLDDIMECINNLGDILFGGGSCDDTVSVTAKIKAIQEKKSYARDKRRLAIDKANDKFARDMKKAEERLAKNLSKNETKMQKKLNKLHHKENKQQSKLNEQNSKLAQCDLPPVTTENNCEIVESGSSSN
ncbi:MAG: hypothetical protein D6808_02435 [Candidatus Dadabacteria bacterium]|nr:MAG: hypothetical protein D6808_02435 [Candidatus Dadabacteria bacterium]